MYHSAYSPAQIWLSRPFMGMLNRMGKRAEKCIKIPWLGSPNQGATVNGLIADDGGRVSTLVLLHLFINEVSELPA